MVTNLQRCINCIDGACLHRVRMRESVQRTDRHVLLNTDNCDDLIINPVFVARFVL